MSESKTSPKEAVPTSRRRNLLREFYGIQQSSPNIEKEVIDTTNINSHHFDSSKYYEDLLKTNNLASLIEIDNSMIAEIKKLDSDMKTLVYENYNKFITATETIRKMKSNVESMEEEMRRLGDNMSKISSCSDHINNSLSVRREKIEKLSGVHRLLKKLQFLVELPARLQKSVELEAYSQAVKYYVKTTNILQRYDNLPSFKQIHKECEQIIKDLKVVLKDRIRNPKTPTPEVTESVSLLIELKEPPLSLRNEFLDCRKRVLHDKLDNFSTNDFKSVSIDIALTELNKTFLADFLESSKCYRLQFVERETSTTDKKEATHQLDSFTKDLFSKYFTIVKAIVAETKELTDMIAGLSILQLELNKAHNTIPYLGISEKAADLINSTVQNQIEFLFSSLQLNVRDTIQKLNVTVASQYQNSQPGTLNTFCKSTATSLLSLISTLLEKFMFFLSSEADFVSTQANTFMTKIHVMCEQFFLLLNINILEYHEDEIKVSNSTQSTENTLSISYPRFILILSKLCLEIEKDGITEVANSLTKLRNLVDPKRDFAFSVNVSELQARLKSTAEKMLAYFIKLQSQKLSQMIWKGVDGNWFKIKEAKTPKPVLELIIEEIRLIDLDLKEVYPNDFDSKTMKVSSSASATAKKNDKNLFEKKIVLSSDVEFARTNILTDIVKLSLKAFLEYARLKTYGKTGYQQMQIDVYFLQKSLNYFINANHSVIARIFEEILVNTGERCVEVVPLEQSALAAISEPKLAKYQQANAFHSTEQQKV